MNRTLVTGGGGFIGCNLVDRLLTRGESVLALDNLSRPGSEENVRWLEARHGPTDDWFLRADVRDAAAVASAVLDVDRIVHLAGQVAVTEAVLDPRTDFESNALGTFNVLEAARCSERDPVVLYASTNKVYGNLEQIAVREEETRYCFEELTEGVDENCTLAPISPYGCSKAVGDLYALDYHRIFGVRTVVLRQSCIYGSRQFGVEAQGWVAWFALAAVQHRELRIFGDGKQVRDLLWVEDLLDAYDAVFANIDEVAGEVFNIGGGQERSLSVWQELRPRLEDLVGRPLTASFHPWRPGEQKVYVSDVRKARRLLGWQPRMGLDQGIARLVEWASRAEGGSIDHPGDR